MLKNINLSLLAGWSARGASMACGLLNTKLLLNLLGTDGYAAQSILISLAPWLALLNFGLPKSVQNTISMRRAQDADYSAAKYSACAVAAAGILAATPLLVISSFAVNLFLLHDFDVSVWTVLATCMALTMFGLSSVFSQILFAEHRPLWPNISNGLVALCQSALLLLLRYADVHDFSAVIYAFISPWLLISLLMAMLVGGWKQWRFSATEMAPMIRQGMSFTLFAAISTATLNFDYAAMGLLLNSTQIVEYSLANKMFMAPFAIHTVVLAAYWTPLSDLYFAGKHAEMRRQVHKILFLGCAVVCAPTLGLVLLSQCLVPILSGGTVTTLPQPLMWVWFLLIALRVWSDTYAMTQMCTNRMRLLNAYIPVQTVISIASQFALAPLYGGAGIAGGIVVSFLLTAVWITPMAFYRGTALQDHS